MQEMERTTQAIQSIQWDNCESGQDLTFVNCCLNKRSTETSYPNTNSVLFLEEKIRKS